MEKNSNKKKTIIKLIFVLVLVLIIVYTFRGSWDDIWDQLKETAPVILIMIAASSVIYHLFEALITYTLAKRYNPRFRYRDAVYCAFFCSFYRLSTLGSAQGVAAVVFLGKKGVDYSEATGLYMMQYMLHKVSIAAFSGIFFLLNWQVMSHHYRNYAIYLIFAYILTVLISVGLILLAVWTKSHELILFLANKLNRSHKLDALIGKLESSVTIMEESTAKLLKDAKLITRVVLMNMAKLCFWYGIPFLILFGTAEITILDSLSVTSLSVMTAAVIPTPAGIGSTELIMTTMYRALVDVKKAGAITLLYRVATFIFPFVVGGVMILTERAVKQFRSR